MSNILELLTISISILFLSAASYFSYVIYKYNKEAKAWLGLTFGIILVSLRQVTLLFIILGILPEQYFGLNILTVLLAKIGIFSSSAVMQIFDRGFLTLAISVFIAWGLYSMMTRFEEFNVIKSSTKSKIKTYLKKRR